MGVTNELPWRRHLRRAPAGYHQLPGTPGVRRKIPTGQHTLITMENVTMDQQNIAVEQIIWNFDVRPLSIPRKKVSQHI